MAQTRHSKEINSNICKRPPTSNSFFDIKNIVHLHKRAVRARIRPIPFYEKVDGVSDLIVQSSKNSQFIDFGKKVVIMKLLQSIKIYIAFVSLSNKYR